MTPLLLVVPAGDVVMNYMQIACFSEHLWSGDLYPRWCMSANAGLGSPAPIFYFPLPFWVSALFAGLGMSTEQRYLLGVFTANMVAFTGCFYWLRGQVRPSVALLIGFIFLCSGYRSELLARTSYAEFWGVSLLPWLFYYLRKLCDDPGHHRLKLGLVTWLFLLSHAPGAVIGLVGAGVFTLCYSKTLWRSIKDLVLAVIPAFILAMPHLLPMILLGDSLNPLKGGPAHWQQSWTNSFVDTPGIAESHPWVLVGLMMNLLVAAVIFAFFWLKRRTIHPAKSYREACAWLIVALVAFAMLWSYSWPLWWPIKLVSGITTPWRMTSLIVLAMMFHLAVLLEHVVCARKTSRGDRTLIALLFAILGLFYGGGVADGSRSAQQTLIDAQYSLFYFAPREVNARHFNVDLFFDDFVNRPNRQQAEWAGGAGDISVTRWGGGEIHVEGRAERAGVLRLEHFYYPIWRSELNGTPTPIRTEETSGRMLVDIPQGPFTLIIREDYWGLLRRAIGR